VSACTAGAACIDARHHTVISLCHGPVDRPPCVPCLLAERSGEQLPFCIYAPCLSRHVGLTGTSTAVSLHPSQPSQQPPLSCTEKQQQLHHVVVSNKPCWRDQQHLCLNQKLGPQGTEGLAQGLTSRQREEPRLAQHEVLRVLL
jgi:hypothetical protein